jgi:hypothetical protein
MNFEVDAYQKLAKGLRLSPLFDIKTKSGKGKPKGKIEKNKPEVISVNKKEPKVMASKPESSVNSTIKPIASSNIPNDIKPAPIGLSNTSNLPAVNLGGIGTRSKQFKGQ